MDRRTFLRLLGISAIAAKLTETQVLAAVAAVPDELPPITVDNFKGGKGPMAIMMLDAYGTNTDNGMHYVQVCVGRAESDTPLISLLVNTSGGMTCWVPSPGNEIFFPEGSMPVISVGSADVDWRVIMHGIDKRYMLIAGRQAGDTYMFEANLPPPVPEQFDLFDDDEEVDSWGADIEDDDDDETYEWEN